MKQLSPHDPFLYEVAQGEQVTFEITPVGADRRGITATDRKTISDSNPSGTPTFTTTIKGKVGSIQIAKFEFSFLGGSAPNAKFDIAVLGGQGKRFGGVPSVGIGSNLKEYTFTFSVV